MKLRVSFVIEEGPAALKQVAACVGFANQLGIGILMQPEDDPRADNVRWKAPALVPKADFAKFGKSAQRILSVSDSATMPRKEFVKGVADLSGLSTKAVGAALSRWIRLGAIEEVE